MRYVPPLLLLLLCLAPVTAAEPLAQAPNTWVKRSPLPGGPISPGMGYEAALAYDPVQRQVIRWGGHNQGGGGEQNSETWAFDPATAKWVLKEPNTSPPGVCCAQQNVFNPIGGRFVRFPAFSGSHGWHWFRENYLSNSSLWTYDLARNTWRDMRPLPAPRVAPLRCASWDSDHQVVVVFGGEGSSEGTLVCDPFTNTWTRMSPKVQPAFRSGGNMAYDAAHKLHILFGSQFTNDPHTWAYDLRKNEWRDMKPAVQPPTDRNDAVLAYDTNGEVVIAVVRVIDEQGKDEISRAHLETWAYDAGTNEWKPMKPIREVESRSNRRRILVAVPDQNVLLMENYVNPTERVPGVEREQQIWTYRHAELRPEPALLPPSGLTVAVTSDAAIVRWKPSPTPNVAGYVIYRGESPQLWRAELQAVARVGGDQTSFHDSNRKAATVAWYAIRALDRTGRESADSVKVSTQPHLVEDAVVSVLSPSEVRIAWAPVADRELAGYVIERADAEVFSDDQVLRLKKETPPLAEPSVGTVKAIGPFRRLTASPVSGTTYTDRSVDLDKRRTVLGQETFTHRFRDDQLDHKGKPYPFGVYAYRIRAVNALGVESGPSPYWLTIPSAPQSLFAREEQEKCHLKWAANPEQGLRGYRVYRMEGPRVNGPGQPVTRLVADPAAETRYTDTKAGMDTRRFWVVAVDALGQEGIPSAPAWHYRQYRRHYEPFVGDWHQ